jgi:hypothetical protein
VIDGDGAYVYKFGEVVLVRHVITVPGHDIEGRVILCRLEEFAAKFVDDLPGFMLDLIFCDWVKEVAGIG